MSFCLLSLAAAKTRKLITARSSSDFACCFRAISMAFRKHSSASSWPREDLSIFTLDLQPVEASARLSADTARPRHTRSPVLSTRTNASASAASPSSRLSHFPIRLGQHGKKTALLLLPCGPAAARPWRISAIPSSPCPCFSQAQPSTSLPAPTRAEILAPSRG